MAIFKFSNPDKLNLQELPDLILTKQGQIEYEKSVQNGGFVSTHCSWCKQSFILPTEFVILQSLANCLVTINIYHAAHHSEKINSQGNKESHFWQVRILKDA